MCLAFPARVVDLLPEDQAVVDLEGVRKTISLMLMEDIAVGDYVIVHVGYALSKLDPAEAQRTLELMRQATGMSPAAAGAT
jgi:hydrogenase expression/formation protein HypC